MKKVLSLTFLVLFFVVMLVSCDDDLSPDVGVADTESPQEPAKDVPSVTLTQDEMILLTELSNGTPKLSKEQALEIANNFLGKESANTSLSKRGALEPRCEVLTRAKHSLSKSGTSTDNVDTMLYVFNYDEGFAVVSADVRVPEEILAYSDGDCLNLDSVCPGIQIFLDMAQEYVEYNIMKAELMRDSLYESLNDKFQDALGVVSEQKHCLSKVKREISRTKVYSNIKRTHVKTDLVGPYITTFWHQRKPYNELVPIKGGKKCPAGCVAVAFSQLMAFWQCPLRRTDNYDFMWPAIVGPKPDDFAIADLIKDVGFDIHTNYDTSGSGAHTEDGIELLKKYGYITNELIPYSFTQLKQSLDKERPVIIDGDRRAVNDGKTKKIGHCWLVDGYAKETFQYAENSYYRVVFKDDETGEISEETEIIPEHGTSAYYYQHFNLGWEGQSSTRGYYLANVFDTSREYLFTSPDKNKLTYQPDPDNRDYDYKYNVRIAPNIYCDFDYRIYTR